MKTQEEKDDVSGPRVKRLLTQPLMNGETLALTTDGFEIQDRSMGWRQCIHVFRIYSKELSRSKTCAELAAEVDAFLIARSAENAKLEAEKAAKLEAYDLEQAAFKRKVFELTGQDNPFALLPFLSGLDLRLAPNSEGGWWLSLPGSFGSTRITDAQAVEVVGTSKGKPRTAKHGVSWPGSVGPENQAGAATVTRKDRG